MCYKRFSEQVLTSGNASDLFVGRYVDYPGSGFPYIYIRGTSTNMTGEYLKSVAHLRG